MKLQQLQKVQVVLDKVSKIESSNKNRNKQKQLKELAEQEAKGMLGDFTKIFNTCDFEVMLIAKVEQVKESWFVPYIMFKLDGFNFIITSISYLKPQYKISCFLGSQKLGTENFDLCLKQSPEVAIKPILEFVAKSLNSYE